MQPRTVRAGHGWIWIKEGFALFRRSPANWSAIVLLLFAATKLLALVSLLGIVVVLLMPIFIVGLMEGCRALERGEPLQLAHLACGFRRNAAQLVTIGGVSLVGNIAAMMLVMTLGGEAMSTLASAVAQGGRAAGAAADVQAASSTLASALIVGMLVSLPLLMAVWYSPLLVYFRDMTAIEAMKSSLIACIRNGAALFVYGLLVLGGMFIAMPFAMSLRQYDLALWLLAPVLLPSLYASYKDIYEVGSAPEAGAEPSV
jgi:hypothetical protein